MTERRYLILIEADAAGCSAYSPDLPGCVATAATREDLEREMRDAIAFHLEGLQQAGERIPEPSGVTAAYVTVAA
jgi:predicted RNase H-like HicB family nuclease